METTTAVAIGVIILVIFIIVGVGIGIGIYFYEKNKKKKPPYQVFGVQFPSSAFVKDAVNTSDLTTKAQSYIDAVKAQYGVSSLATYDQLNTAVTKYGLTTCFFGMVDNDFENVYIAPYLTSQDQVKGNQCTATSANVNAHVINKNPITYSSDTSTSTNYPPIQGYFVYAKEGTDPPANGSTVTIAGNTCTVVANYI